MGREVDEISGEIVDAAYKLHTQLGPGLLESVYETVLARARQAWLARSAAANCQL